MAKRRSSDSTLVVLYSAFLSAAAYTQGRAEIQSGDVMVLYSDGLVEAMNASGEEFGETRLTALLSQVFRSNPEKIRASILASIRAFLKDVAAHDDLTCVVAKFGSSIPDESALLWVNL